MLLLSAKATAAPVPEFSPEQIPQAVGVIKKSLFKDLLVQPRPVESGLHAQFDILPESLVAGRGLNPIRVVALIQDEPLEDRLTVQSDRFPVDGDTAQADVAARLVHQHPFAIHQAQDDIVKMRIFVRPEPPTLSRDHQVQAGAEIVLGGTFGLGDDASAVEKLSVQPQTCPVNILILPRHCRAMHQRLLQAMALLATSGVKRGRPKWISGTGSIHTLCQMPVVRT